MHRSRKTTTRWNLFFSYFSVVYATVSGLLLVPLYLRHIPVDVYGAWLASGNILFWLSALDMGIGNVVIQRVGNAYGQNDLEAAGGFAAAGVLLCGFLGLVVGIFGWIVGNNLAGILNLSVDLPSEDLSNAFIIASVGTGLSLLSFGLGGANRGLQESFSVGIVFSLAQMLSLVSVVLAILFGLGLYALAIGILLRPIIDLAGNVIILYRRWQEEELVFCLRSVYVSDICAMLSFSSIGRVGLTVSDKIDAFLLARFMGPEVVSSFVLSRRGIDIARMLLLRPGNALSPAVAHLKGEGKLERGRDVLTRFLIILFWVGGLAFAGFISLNKAFITAWVGHDFYIGNSVNTVFALMLVVGVVVRNMALLCNAMGDIRTLALVSALRAVVVVVLMIVGIRNFGALGAAVAPLLGLILVTLPYVIKSFNRLVQLDKPDWKKLAVEATRSVLASCLLCFLSKSFVAGSPINLFFGIIATTILYSLTLYIISTPFRTEIKVLASGAYRRFSRA